MMLQTRIVKNGVIRISDQYPRSPMQVIRITKTMSSSFDALSFRDRSSSFKVAGPICLSTCLRFLPQTHNDALTTLAPVINRGLERVAPSGLLTNTISAAPFVIDIEESFAIL
jgi:hypothetical protein